MCLATCATAACCCAGSACCSCLCLPAKAIGIASKNYSKIGYVMFQLVWICFAFLVLFAGTWIVSWGQWVGITCPSQSGSADACFSASGLVRISWALAWFQLLILLITLMRNDTAAILHDGWWTLKFFIVAALFIGSFWIPNSPTITGYMEFSRYVSVIYLSYQAMLMLIVAYVINNGLVTAASKYEGGGLPGILLVALFFIFTGGNITWLIFQFIEFSACGGNLAIMIITTVIGTAMYGLVLLRSRPDASVFTSSLVFTYCLFLQWSAFSSDSVDTCNPFNAASNSGKNVRANTIMMMIIGLLFVFASLLVVASITKHEDEA